MLRCSWVGLVLLSLAGCGDDVAPMEDASVACASDTECDDGVFCNGAESCDPTAAAANAFGCLPSPGDPCIAGTTCSEPDDACQTQCDVNPDADSDGVDSMDCGGTDCDDSDADRYPGNTEVCDSEGVDEDCDETTFGDTDGDDDGFVSATCCNGDTCGRDCDDSRPAVFQGATEACNAIDDDCDGTVDEELSVQSYRPDCDLDNFADPDGTVVMDCAPPATPPASCPTGGWATNPGDCDDTTANRNPGNPELCNAIDDDCDELVDDITDGVVVCALGETGTPCMNACGVAGTGSCTADCLELVCSSSATELCNYCDDDEDGSLAGEVALATESADPQTSCGGAEFGDATCMTRDHPTNGFYLDANLLDGATNDSAGAVWISTIEDTVGFGPTEIDIVLDARTVPTGGANRVETPLGGWAIVVTRDLAATGVGTPEDRGVPAGVAGVSAHWMWERTYYSSCPGGDAGVPASTDDAVRLFQSSGTALAPQRAEGLTDSWNCYSGDPIGTGGYFGSGDTSFVQQRMRLRYTPDDPSTAGTDEEMIEIIVHSGGTRTYTYLVSDLLPPGTDIKIGLTAGTYSRVYSREPTLTFGVPVEARVQLWRMTVGSMGMPNFTERNGLVYRDGLCP